MKQLFIILFIALSITARAQPYCGEAFHTISPNYSYSGKNHFMGVEIGKVGDESPHSAHIGISMPVYTMNNGKSLQESPIGSMYFKYGYRLYRKEYKLSLYTMAKGGMDIATGLFYGASLRFLVPKITKAYSIEPYITNHGLGIQANAHFIIY